MRMALQAPPSEFLPKQAFRHRRQAEWNAIRTEHSVGRRSRDTVNMYCRCSTGASAFSFTQSL